MNSIRLDALLAVSILALVSACSSFPSPGPTEPQIRKEIAKPKNDLGLKIVEINDISDIPQPERQLPDDLPMLPPPPTDMVGSGDVLGIAIFEAGVSLFGKAPNDTDTAFDGTAKAQTLPPTRVDDAGYISVPYAGRLHVAGKTVGEIQAQIRDALKGLSQNPQVLVSLRETINNSVIVSGEVAHPGRLVLQTNRETFTDAIALAGGYRGSAKDLALRVTRRDKSLDIRLSVLIDNPSLDIPAYPGDRIALINSPRSYSMLGASGRVDQIAFNHASIMLAEAVAAAGGTNPNVGDPAAVFLFRYVLDASGHEQPIVYHLNMMQVGSYFLATRFAIRDRDIVYIGSARSNQASKLAQFVSQLFSPALTVVSGVQAAHYVGN